jgi:hypothetical protein
MVSGPWWARPGPFSCNLLYGAVSPTVITVVPGKNNAEVSVFGVNLSGAEFGGNRGVYGTDYIYPNAAELDY